MIKLRITNFQSIEDQTLEISKFTILIGTSNLGKSAVNRALRAILYNDFDKSFIRVGEDTCKLTLTFLVENDIGINQIEFTRSYSKNINEYKVHYTNGNIETFDKVGTDTPDIIKILGYKYLELERTSQKINMNFQSQLEGLFLFNSSEVELSSFFNKIFNVDKYENALRDCNKDILNFTKDYNKAQKEISIFETQFTLAEQDKIESKAKLEKAEALKIQADKLLLLQSKLIELKNLKIDKDNLALQLSSFNAQYCKITSISKAFFNYANIKKYTFLRSSEIQLKSKIIQDLNTFGNIHKISNKLEIYNSIKSFKLLQESQQSQTYLSGLATLYLTKLNIDKLKKLYSYKKYLEQSKFIKLIKENIVQYTSIEKAYNSVNEKLGILKQIILIKKLNISKNSVLLPIEIDYSSYINKELRQNNRVCSSCNQICSSHL